MNTFLFVPGPKSSFIAIIRSLFLLTLLLSALASKAQQNEDLLNLLIQKKLISKQEADSIRADQAVKDQAKREKDSQHNVTFGKGFQVGGLIQARYQTFQQNGVNDAFDLHRARLDIKGNITTNWDYDLYTEFASGTKLLDAYVSYKLNDNFKFTAGQFKIPFSLENLASDSQLEFIDRSQVVEALTSRSKDVIGNNIGRDIGAQLSGSFLKLDGRYIFDYSIGVFNGAGFNVGTDNNKNKDISGRLVVHPVKGLDLGVSFYEGEGVWGIPTTTQDRNRRGIDAKFVTGPLSLTAEYIKGTDGAIDRDGYYAQAGYYVLPKKLQLVARVDNYDPNKSLYTDRSTIYAGGVNYFFNSWAKLAVNYLYKHEEVVQIQNNILEAQLQLVF